MTTHRDIKMMVYGCLFCFAFLLAGCRERRDDPYRNPESPIDDANDWKNNDYDNDTTVQLFDRDPHLWPDNRL